MAETLITLACGKIIAATTLFLGKNEFRSHVNQADRIQTISGRGRSLITPKRTSGIGEFASKPINVLTINNIDSSAQGM